jgi:hypothetical protein
MVNINHKVYRQFIGCNHPFINTYTFWFQTIRFYENLSFYWFWSGEKWRENELNESFVCL